MAATPPAPLTRAIPGVRLGPAQGRPHVAHPHRAAREPREQRLSVLCATDEILKEAGYGVEEIERLRRESVV